MEDQPGERGDRPDSPGWWKEGEEPDYRATLANERTFLAWARTALALMAGSLAVLQLVTAVPAALRLAIAFYLIALAMAATLTGYRLWRLRQHRMRRRQPLGHTPVQALMATALLLLGALIAVVAALAPPG
ncbi:putative membrane protein [Streptacidiphilus sp. MAP12-16]|uniref:YidH family protein n=1 Tax=Streptacidiphilus sp. MAP12-16 TaxID=3156300 RepID=UPI0035119BAB